MNAKRVAAAEGVILAAMQTRVTAAGVAVALESACLLQSPESAAELARLRSLLGAKPLDLTEEQRDALSDAGNRALNDHYHEDLCFCREWPESCATRGYFQGMWDTAAFDIGLGAVLGLWESMRADAAAARVAELEAERHSTNEALSDAAEQLRVQRDRIVELEAERASIVAERDAQIVAWLGKKAREYGESNRESRAKAEAVWRMADKLSRGAVRPFAPRRATAGELAEQRHLVDPLDHALEALAPRTVKSAFGLANDHIRGGCGHCRPSMRLPEMCPEGQRLSLAACKSIIPTAGSAL